MIMFFVWDEIWTPSWDLTLTDAVALEPGAWGIPHKLLPVFLDGYVEGVTDIWVVEVSHTQDLWKKNGGKGKVKTYFVQDQTELSPFKTEIYINIQYN